MSSNQISRLPSAFLWILTAAYIYILLLSPPGQMLPGEPVWAIKPETVEEIFNESINFFFVLPILNAIGFNYLQAPSIHPWQESLFNFAEAWMLMFLPLIVADSRGRGLPKLLIWSLAMFLTNTFLIPYMALRKSNLKLEEPPNKGLLAPILGWIGLMVGIIAIFWSFFGRPEFGGIEQRSEYFVQTMILERLTIAFCVDLVFFAIFQIVLIGDIEPPGSRKRWLRFIPFWGLVAWLLI